MWYISSSSACVARRVHRASSLRRLSSAPPRADFAFTFDIDGVLLRGQKPLPKASDTLNYLQKSRIPFLLLTNGGGLHETDRATALTEELSVEIEEHMVLQSHTPFNDYSHLKEKTVLVVGGEGDRCRQVARRYGFKKTITPSDIFAAYPGIWQFSKPLASYHEQSRPRELPAQIDPSFPGSLKIDAIFVYNDPRDWGLDATIIVDCLLSTQGVIGTLSSKNGNSSLKKKGYQQDGQPPLYFSNPDLWFASDWTLPRLGQGGFRAALEGIWSAITGGIPLDAHVLGKPMPKTYEFAERRLLSIAKSLNADNLHKIYMVGDNPASDIQGAINHRSALDIEWKSALVRTGVFTGEEPAYKPSVIVDDVAAAVDWGLQDSGWPRNIR